MIEGIKLDLRVRTAPDIKIQTAFAQKLQAEGEMNVRGTLTNPGVLGRITASDGNLIFFGNQYTINRGLIAFYNPTRIEPVVGIDLETKIKGVDVTLSVSGPIDALKLTYRSNPPVRFEESLGLLSPGK